MRRPMAGHAARCVRIARCSRLSVDALPELLHFIGMALGAFCWHHLSGRNHFVVIAVTGLARSLAERAVHAVGQPGSLVGVASRALNFRRFGGVRIVLDAGVAVFAAQNAVDAGRVLRRIKRDALAVTRRHSRLTMAGQATFVLFQRMGHLSLCSATGVCRDAD